MKSFKISALIIALVLSLAGCASFNENLEGEKMIVQIATMKVIERADSQSGRHDRAGRILSVVSEAKVFLDTESVGINQLREHLLNRVLEQQLEPSDQILATLLVDQVINGLKTRVVDGVNLPATEIRYQINTVLSWVETAASLY